MAHITLMAQITRSYGTQFPFLSIPQQKKVIYLNVSGRVNRIYLPNKQQSVKLEGKFRLINNQRRVHDDTNCSLKIIVPNYCNARFLHSFEWNIKRNKVR